MNHRAPTYDVRVAVRFGDIDMFGHVNHARYLGYCEEHRTAMFSQLRGDIGVDLLDAGFVVGAVRVTYFSAVGPEHREVVIRGSVDRVGRSSFQMRYVVTAGDRVAALVTSVLVVIAATGPRPLSDVEQDWLQGWATAADDEQIEHRL